MGLKNLTIRAVQEGLTNKDFSAVELTKHYLGRIAALNPALNAFLTESEADSYLAAAEADEHIAHGLSLQPLEGVPGAVKDVIVTKGVRTTAGSKMLEGYIPPYDATVVRRLKENGYVPLGKTNCDEFAMGGSNENSAFGPVKNPWDRARVPGGSSGGSAAAVAAGLAPFALGTDTGGSIRQPASLCGVTGLKPTYGSVSRYGLIALVSSFDAAGVFARTVEDAEIVFNVIQGHDPRDATSVSQPQRHAALDSESRNDIKKIRIGIPIEYVGHDWDAPGIEEGVKTRVQEALAELERHGAVIKTISLPHAPYALACYYIINPCEASSNLARFDGIRFGGSNGAGTRMYGQGIGVPLQTFYEQQRARGFGPEPVRRIMMGTYALSSGYYDAYYKKAAELRLRIADDFSRAFEDVDLIASPTSPTVAFPLGAKANDPLSMYLGDIFTVAVNIAGLPALSLLCGFASAPDDKIGSPPKKRENERGGIGLPVGLQLIAPCFEEALLFSVGKHYQTITDHHLKTPPL